VCFLPQPKPRSSPHLTRTAAFSPAGRSQLRPLHALPSRSCGKVRKGLRERVRTVSVPTREWVVFTAPASKRWPKPAPVPPDCPPPRRRVGFRPLRRGDRVPSCRCHDPRHRRSECQKSLLWTRPGFIISAAARPLGPTTALDRTCCSSHCSRSPGFAVSVSFRVDFV
jgi:hypothetical protein